MTWKTIASSFGLEGVTLLDDDQKQYTSAIILGYNKHFNLSSTYSEIESKLN